MCFLLGIVVPIVRKRHPVEFSSVESSSWNDNMLKIWKFLYTFFLQSKQGNFLSQGCQDKRIWRRKQTKVTVFFTWSAFLLVSTFVEAILTTSTSACQPSCGSQLLWKPHQLLLRALLRHLHMLRHSSVDWLVGWSTSSSAPSRSALKMCSFSFVMEHKWKSK